MTKWPYKSSSGPGTYYVQLADDGQIVCDCRGYLIKRPGKMRSCRHIDDVVKKSNFTVEAQGDLQYVIANDLAVPVQASLVDFAEQYNSAITDGYIQPMLASAMTKRPKDEPWEVTILPYQDGNWVSEIKYDGQRMILSKGNGKVLAWSRPKEGDIGLPRKLPPHIHDFAQRCLPDGTFDGEEIAGLMGKSYDVGRLDKAHLKQFAVFDILRLQTYDITDLPQVERRQILEGALLNCTDDTPVILAAQTQPTAEQIRSLWATGAEGVILKKLDASYKPGWRSPYWLKIKLEAYVTCVITGYEKAKNGPYAKVKLLSSEGVETSCKTKDNAQIAAFEADPDAFIGRRLVIKHYGPTPDGKYRGPIIWDHWAGEGE